MKTNKKILIIEDDPWVASALNVRIASAGYETVQAADAISAVSTALATRPDLVLVDINMPAGDGFWVVERIQALIPGRLPAVFITASKEPGLAERAFAKGASGFIEKPYNPENLLKLLHNLLEKPNPPDDPSHSAQREASPRPPHERPSATSIPSFVRRR